MKVPLLLSSATPAKNQNCLQVVNSKQLPFFEKFHLFLISNRCTANNCLFFMLQCITNNRLMLLSSILSLCRNRRILVFSENDEVREMFFLINMKSGVFMSCSDKKGERFQSKQRRGLNVSSWYTCLKHSLDIISIQAHFSGNSVLRQ